jgi:hypothetical protein
MGAHGSLRVMVRLRKYVAWAWIALAACAAPSRPPSNSVTPDGYTQRGSTDLLHVSADPWPDASERFHVQPVWLGADSAYSIDLDATHVLWLFADTFLDPAADGTRENGPNFFIRNSVAIQSGHDLNDSHDLSKSQLQFYWGPNVPGPPSAPSSFFRDFDGSEAWVWPLHGARLSDGRLLLFRMHVQKETGGLGFKVDGWDALAIDDPAQSPDTWQPRVLTSKRQTFGKLVGSSVLVHDAFVYAYAVNNQGTDHAIYLARWSESELLGLNTHALDDPEWWTKSGFTRQSALNDGEQLEPLFRDGQVELSVHYDATRQRFIEIQMQGLFVAEETTQIGLRSAPHPEGPWSALTPFFRPSEHALPNASDLAAYAAKAHPEQRGANWVLSYVVNDLKRFPPGDSVYYPKLLRVHVD